MPNEQTIQLTKPQDYQRVRLAFGLTRASFPVASPAGFLVNPGCLLEIFRDVGQIANLTYALWVRLAI